MEAATPNEVIVPIPYILHCTGFDKRNGRLSVPSAIQQPAAAALGQYTLIIRIYERLKCYFKEKA